MRQAIVLSLALLPLWSCAHEPAQRQSAPYIVTGRTGYNCDEILTENGERFSLTSISPDPGHAWVVGWTRQLSDGIKLEVQSMIADGDAFVVSGFAGPGVGGSRFNVSFNQRAYGWSPFDKSNARHDLVMEIRVGTRSIRKWGEWNAQLSVMWPELVGLLEGDGDFVIQLYDASTTLQQATLPRSFPDHLEATFKAMHARVEKRAANKETECERYEYSTLSFIG